MVLEIWRVSSRVSWDAQDPRTWLNLLFSLLSHPGIQLQHITQLVHSREKDLLHRHSGTFAYRLYLPT